MTPAQQFRNLGACVEASGEMVIVQVGNSMKAMTPRELRVFIKCATRELFRAEIITFDHELQAVRT